MQIVIGDALAVALLEGRGFTSQDFRVYHPGGKLGAQLKQVRSVMHSRRTPSHREPWLANGGRGRDHQRQGLRLCAGGG